MPYAKRVAKNKKAREYRKRYKFLSGVRIELDTYEEIRALAASNNESISETIASLIQWGLGTVDKEINNVRD
jgi:hypothetical protein